MSTVHGQTVSGYLPAYDRDDDFLTYSLLSGPSHGSLTINPDGTFSYTPAPGFVGQDRFTFQANDGIADTNIVTETIDVTNQAPLVYDDKASTPHNHAVTASLQALDWDNDAVAFSLVFGAANGSVMVYPDGTFSYTPASGFVGQDVFMFQATDGFAWSNLATVTIDVTNLAPADVYEDLHIAGTYTGSVHAIDTDQDLTYSLVSGPSNGTLSFNSDGSFTYTSASLYNNGVIDSFWFKANDGYSDGIPASVTLTNDYFDLGGGGGSGDPNDPMASDDSIYMYTKGAIGIDVMGNDNDPDQDPIDIASVTNGQHGTVQIIHNGPYYHPGGTDYSEYPSLVVYTLNDPDFRGSDSFQYTIGDGRGGSDTATVKVYVVWNHAPVIRNPGNIVSTEGDTPRLRISASDQDGDPIAYGAQGLPPGLSIDRFTGMITGSIPYYASNAYPYNVMITASDLTANPQAGGDPESLDSTTSFLWKVNVARPEIYEDDWEEVDSSEGDAVERTVEAWDPPFSSGDLPSERVCEK